MQKRSLTGLAYPALPIDSVAAALQAVQLLAIDGIDYQCLAGLSLSGRFQCTQTQGRQVILDVAHNPAAARYLAGRLAEQPCSGRSFALMAVMSDKDSAGMVAALKDCFAGWFVADLPHLSRALPAAALAAVIQQQLGQTVSVEHNIAQAYRRVLSLMQAGDRLVVFGSFFTVAEVLRLQQADKNTGG
jgi:dihydrofolate synthase/folylpolyglutamate synthase